MKSYLHLWGNICCNEPILAFFHSHPPWWHTRYLHHRDLLHVLNLVHLKMARIQNMSCHYIQREIYNLGDSHEDGIQVHSIYLGHEPYIQHVHLWFAENDGWVFSLGWCFADPMGMGLDWPRYLSIKDNGGDRTERSQLFSVRLFSYTAVAVVTDRIAKNPAGLE